MEPNDFPDLEHAMIGAYADVAFMDRESFNAVTQAQRGRQESLIPRDFDYPYRKSGPLDVVLRTIAGLKVSR